MGRTKKAQKCRKKCMVLIPNTKKINPAYIYGHDKPDAAVLQRVCRRDRSGRGQQQGRGGGAQRWHRRVAAEDPNYFPLLYIHYYDSYIIL